MVNNLHELDVVIINEKSKTFSVTRTCCQKIDLVEMRCEWKANRYKLSEVPPWCRFEAVTT